MKINKNIYFIIAILLVGYAIIITLNDNYSHLKLAPLKKYDESEFSIIKERRLIERNIAPVIIRKENSKLNDNSETTTDLPKKPEDNLFTPHPQIADNQTPEEDFVSEFPNDNQEISYRQPETPINRNIACNRVLNMFNDGVKRNCKSTLDLLTGTKISVQIKTDGTIDVIYIEKAISTQQEKCLKSNITKVPPLTDSSTITCRYNN